MASSSSPKVTSSPMPTSSDDNQGGTASSPLYLFTFLATLVLLILISFAIIVRSFVLRRRFRRRVEEALAAGAILPVPAPRGNRQRRDHRERPIIYDTWVKSGGEKWQYMMPMAAQLTPNRSSSESEPAKGDVNSEAVSSFNPFALLRVPRGSPTPGPKSGTITPNLSSNLNGIQTDGNFQVSVLVVMPSAPNSKPKTSKDGAEIPDIVIGVAHMPYRSDNKGPPTECSKVT